MSARKWNFYDLAVGERVVLQGAPQWIAKRISEHGKSAGKKFKTRLVGERQREVRRVA